jgi:hypothetical protein
MNETARRPFDGPIPQRFSSAYRRYQELGGLVDIEDDARAYAGDEPLWDVERLMFLSLAFDQICKEQLEGDFAELGVYKGSTAALLARHARRLRRRLFLLDTFEGFDERDFTGPDAGRSHGFADTSLETVGEEATTFIKGYFPQTAGELPADGRYCLVHIDTDLYAPIWSGLEYFYQRLVPGGFLIVHDYGSLAWAGAEKAVDAFFADKPECVVHIPDSCGSAVIRRVRSAEGEMTWLQKQQRLTLGEWHSAGKGKLAPLLTHGWAASESWGVWGVGRSHTIEIALEQNENASLAVDLDVHAFVWPAEPMRDVAVVVNGVATSILELGDRKTITIALPPPRRGSQTVTIELQPLRVAVPRDVNPPTLESRELGIALHRIRVGQI